MKITIGKWTILLNEKTGEEERPYRTSILRDGEVKLTFRSIEKIDRDWLLDALLLKGYLINKG